MTAALQSAPSSPLMNRFKIGTRVFTGFIAVLVLMAVVAAIGIFGLQGADSNIDRFAGVSHNALRVSEIDRNVVGLRRKIGRAHV